jgi:hypothetical protein
VPTFLVERYLPGLAAEQVKAALERAEAAAERMTEEGTPVRYLRSTLIAEDEACFSLFEAPSADAVRQANERADAPFDRIVEAVEISQMT